MAQRWLYFNLQCIVAVIAVVVVTLATQLNSPTAGFTGPSIVALMSFGDILNYIIRWWTQMETCVGAVTRSVFHAITYTYIHSPLITLDQVSKGAFILPFSPRFGPLCHIEQLLTLGS